jgi:serine/threonine protein kinase
METDKADEGLEVVLADYLRAAEEGRAPERMELLARHPDLAPELAAYFAGQERFTRLAAPLRDAVSAAQESTIDQKLAEGGRLGDFRLLREVGRGGMGVVYEAEQISLGRRVALKVLPFAGALDAKQLQRFKNEAHAAANLQHQNIVPVYFVGCERGVHFYAMQFVEGQTLAALIQELRQASQKTQSPSAPGSSYLDPQLTGPYTLELAAAEGLAKRGPEGENAAATIEDRGALIETRLAQPRSSILESGSSFFRTVANLGIQAAEALEHAHQLGVIHRDIKPANLMVDARGNLWITDFGLAHCQNQAGLTMSGDLVGTLRYMSPEQALAKRVLVDHRTDIYSLGVTLYELLTLEPALPGRDRQELLRQIAFEDPKPPRRLNQAVPWELETVVLKAIEKDPADRYATAQELADDLERFLKDEPIRARRPSILARLRKWSVRHRRVVTAAVVAAFVAMALSSGLIARQWRLTEAARQDTVQAQKAEERRAEAERQAKEVSDAVLQFMENRVFAAMRPKGQDGGMGREVTLQQAVEAALPFVEKSFPTQPIVEARLRWTIGISFFQLGDAARAAEQFEMARTLCLQHLAPDHPYTLSIMNNLAISYSDLGRHADALKLYEEMLALQKAKLEPDHPEILRTMNNVAESYRHGGRYGDAFKLHQETLALKKAKLAPDDPSLLASMNNLAIAHEALGRYPDALKLYEETLPLRKAKLGRDHPDTLATMHNLANCYYFLARYPDAVKLYEKTLALRKNVIGPDHPQTLATMNNLACAYAELGRHGDALKLYEETLALKKVKLGPDHTDTLASIVNLANSYGDLGRHADAVKLYEEALPVMKAKIPNHPFTFNCISGLANSYGALGRHADALKLNEETLVLRKAKLGRDHSDTLQAMMNLATNYGHLGRHAEALKLHEESLELKKAKLGPDHPNTLQSMWGVAESLTQLKRGAEAVPIIDDCLRRAVGKMVDPRMVPEIMALRLRHFEGSKDGAGCRQTAEMWESLNRADADSLYNAACFRAVTAGVFKLIPDADATRLANEQADQAMAWLQQALAAGFKNVAHMKKDQDLDALRQRPDFMRLLSALEEKTPAPQLLPSGDSKK